MQNPIKKLAKRTQKLAEDIKKDFEVIRGYERKFCGGSAPLDQSLAKTLVTSIGFQSLAAIRCMQFARDLSIPLGGEVLARMIRFGYGMDIHWQAGIEPGVSIVHGLGIVISKHATIKPGCILMQNVTLGTSRDPKTEVEGAPTLEKNVHVGPGATLLGPITIGEGTKIMAGAVVMESVPPNSLVKPAKISITKRKHTQEKMTKDPADDK